MKALVNQPPRQIARGGDESLAVAVANLRFITVFHTNKYGTRQQESCRNVNYFPRCAGRLLISLEA